MPHRLRSYLDRQRTQLEEYLNLLTMQEEIILHGDIDTLERYMWLERTMIENLEALGKVIRPLRDLFPSVTAPDLTHLHRRVSEQHAHNRTLLSQRVEELSRRIQDVNVPRRARSVYRADQSGSMLNVIT
ncbi:MAG TPA: hypothetical protein VJ932_04315 [Alkalispirochaeta sp.]|nr:hypothetical protein [Alkalispirochaeta sp.]